MNTEATIRTFIAVEISCEAQNALAGVVESLSRQRIDGLRLVRPEGIHLTLKFLGNISPRLTNRIADAIATAASPHSPFRLTLASAGAFPNAHRVRVLWVGIDGNLPALHDLQRSIQDALTPLGFAADQQPFNPHLTIGRMHHRASTAARRLAMEALIAAQPPLADKQITVNAISLMKSDLQPGGAVYHRLAQTRLVDASPHKSP